MRQSVAVVEHFFRWFICISQERTLNRKFDAMLNRWGWRGGGGGGKRLKYSCGVVSS